jgi:hypothetical protein
MQAIRTQYKGPTDHKGSRIIATSFKCRTVMPYDHELDLDANHERAAVLHAAKAWSRPVRLKAGTLPDGSVAHVIVTQNGEAV